MALRGAESATAAVYEPDPPQKGSAPAPTADCRSAEGRMVGARVGGYRVGWTAQSRMGGRHGRAITTHLVVANRHCIAEVSQGP